MSQRDPSGIPDLLRDLSEAVFEWLFKENESLEMPNWGVILFVLAMVGILWGVNAIHLSGVK